MASFRALPCWPVESTEIREVFDHREVRQQAEFLAHVADLGPHLIRLGEKIKTQGPGLSRAGCEHAAQHFDGGAFSRAIGTQETEDFFGIDVEGEVPDGGEVAKTLGEARHLQDRFTHGLPPLR